MGQRFTLTASSLGNYFGVGFISPEEQLAIDLGEQERYVSDTQQERMDWGNAFEQPILNYTEKKFNCVVTDRNTEITTIWDALRCKQDGLTILDGTPTGVEAKFSTATVSFIENMGYYLTAQAYMEAKDYGQWLLCGLWNGKYDYKIIVRDNEVIADVKRMVTTVQAILIGMLDKSAFPYDLVEKYASKDDGDVDEFDEDDLVNVKAYIYLSEEIKKLELEKEYTKTLLMEKYKKLKYKNDEYSVTLTDLSRDNGYDIESFKLANPTINIDEYKKPKSNYRRLDIRANKKASK